MAAWARKVVKDPNATTPADIQQLRDSGLDDDQIFAITVSPPFAWRSRRSMTHSALSLTRNSPSLCPPRCARPSPSADL
jgi:hypothetical protein